jgi:hypothetical protein
VVAPPAPTQKQLERLFKWNGERGVTMKAFVFCGLAWWVVEKKTRHFLSLSLLFLSLESAWKLFVYASFVTVAIAATYKDK